MATPAATTVVDRSEVNIDAMTYMQSAFGANFFYLDQFLNRMPPISKFIDQTSKDKNLGRLTVLPSEVLLLVLETLSIPTSCNSGAAADHQAILWIKYFSRF
jgi:hypothetical protein